MTYFAVACSCLYTDNIFGRLALQYSFVVAIGTFLAVSLFSDVADNVFLRGFSLVCLVFFVYDSVVNYSLAIELKNLCEPFLPICGESTDQSTGVTTAYKSHLSAATLIRSLLSVASGLFAGLVCQLYKRKNAG